MRIALSFPGCHTRGGVERVVLECARFLSGRGHDITVFASEFDPAMPDQVHCAPVHISAHPTFFQGPSYQTNAGRAIAAGDFDVLNTHGCVCPVDGVHRVHSVHRAWLEYSKSFRKPFSAARIKQLLNPLHPVLLRMEREHFGRRRYRKLIALTEQVRDDLKRFYNVPEEDVVVVPNGFAPSEFNPGRRQRERAALRSKLGLSDDQFALLFVANELERKGYPAILDALSRLDDPSMILLVLGRTDERVVMEHARQKGVEAQVRYCGATRDVGAYHAASDLFVLPTQYEAFCLAILEALGSGLPVVTSNVPGARDAIRPGMNGLLIEDPCSASQLADAIDAFRRRDDLEDLAWKISASAVEYEWPAVLARYEEVLLKCA
ncbi:MAG: glycosyltransferase family 4 protein [Capsulimonadaceae bacterium]|nr:glycosyltransferase family 4 protein [Capsulimonadaceae bacterium]